jgi:predicted enzyme related to lactoylglutathione lyase
MLKALRTTVYPITDTRQAKDFYTSLTGIEPYFDEPYYIGYNIGGFELGLDPNRKPSTTTDGPIAYWHVDNIANAHAKALDIGAKPHLPIQDVGDGIKVASVLDPFGNVVGLIEDASFKAG